MFMPVSELVLDMDMVMDMDGDTHGMVTVMVLVILGMDMVGVIPVMVGVTTHLITQGMDIHITVMVILLMARVMLIIPVV